MTLADELAVLRPEFMAAPFWFWNDIMEPAEVRRQVTEMAARNIGGFFMHARMGRITPYMSEEWMAAIDAAVDEARKLGLGAWIYDEDGWPSGYGGGAVIALGREYLQQYALAETHTATGGMLPALPDGEEILAAFAARKNGDAYESPVPLDLHQLSSTGANLPDPSCDHVVLFRREVHDIRRYFAPECWADGYVDVLNPKVTRAFIRKIYEPYRRRIGEHFGSVVPGVFTDEPSYHEREWMANVIRLPLSPVLEREFEKRSKRPLRDCLMAIAYGGEEAVRLRWCYFTSLAHLFATNFTKVLADWCAKHGLKFTGHYLLEEYPRASTHVVGDVMQHYAHQQYPGIDHLGKGIDLRFDFWTSSRVLVKQAASVAHQLDKPRVMCETFAGGGWDFGLPEQKWMGDWQYALGLNLCCQHAFHYSLRGFRKRDYPPSLSFQQPWWPISAGLGSHFSRLGYLLTRSKRVVNVLVLHPIESFFATHETAGFPWKDDPLSDSLQVLVRHLLAHQIDFDFGNEVLMKKHGRVADDRIEIGSGAYDVVIIPHSVTWRKSTLAMLRKFASAGGKLLYVEPRPTHVEGELSDTCMKLLKNATSLGLWNDDAFEQRVSNEVARIARPACRLTGDRPEDRDVVMMHRRHDEQDIFFLTSARTTPHTSDAVFDVPGTPMHLDTVSGELSPMAHRRDDAGCHVTLDFDFARSYPIVFDPNHEQIAPDETASREITLCRNGDDVDYHLQDDNALLLDRGELLIDGRSQGEVLTIEAREKIEAHGGEPAVCLRCTFESDIPVARAAMLLETPEVFVVRVNGHEVPTSASGAWLVDPCFRRIEMPGGLPAGTNVVEIECKWHDRIEIEPAYIIGRFGVDASADRPRIISLPGRLGVGSWHDQGLAFYAGRVSYPLEVNIEEAAGRWELECPHYRSAIRVLVNGVEAGAILWAPHRLDISKHLKPGVNRIELEVASSLRNFLGPHHLGREDDIDCLGPRNYFETETRTREYRFKPAGLLGDVILKACRLS